MHGTAQKKKKKRRHGADQHQRCVCVFPLSCPVLVRCFFLSFFFSPRYVPTGPSTKRNMYCLRIMYVPTAYLDGMHSGSHRGTRNVALIVNLLKLATIVKCGLAKACCTCQNIRAACNALKCALLVS